MKRHPTWLLPSSVVSATLAVLLLGACDRRDDPDVDPASTGAVNPPGETVDTDADDGVTTQTAPERIGDGGTEPVEPYDSTDATMPPPQNDPINPTSPPPVDPTDPTDPTNQTPPPTDSNTRDSDNRDDGTPR